MTWKRAVGTRPELPDRRVADGDRREKPRAGYGIAASQDPTNRRIQVRRSWKKNRGRHRNIDDPLTPEEEADMADFLRGFDPKPGR